ncbi:hypothetical protein HPC49_29585 [Pyxidicoccus fallax]|uniref:Uncharacterized protein n=1 Tax=Pyxidicoccus fallax TaxID=394095 RepID=A0A848LZS9_9BACT|nr:DUF6193 family natural product biosynthesis protein [Pyxidicoccus fallax]NMO23100.1 hypothetical protein [Pyxidicoccus fallax]NPC82360.1 hypothetical protein [Pyxidicoccus fallax]
MKRLASGLRALVAQTLGERGTPIPVTLTGAEVNWFVEATVGARTCRVQVFQYLDGPIKYSADFIEAGHSVARGEDLSQDEVARACAAWLLDAVPREGLHQRFPFVDRSKRRLDALRPVLDAALERRGSPLRGRREHGLSSEALWVERDARTCQLTWPPEGEQLHCSFRHRRRSLATVETRDTEALVSAMLRWIDGGARPSELRAEYPFVRLEPYALAHEEGRFAEWRWEESLKQARAAMESRVSSPLVPHLELLERLHALPSARRFYFFTSLWTLKFSRCPDYSSSTTGLPFIIPHLETGPGSESSRVSRRFIAHCGGRTYEGDAAGVCRFVEWVFDAEVDSLFDGNLEDALMEDVDRALAASGSSLRCRRHRDGRVSGLVVEHGGRTCRLTADEPPGVTLGAVVHYYEGPLAEGHVARERFRDVASLVPALRDWLGEAPRS